MTRADGRAPGQPRPLLCERALLHAADGGAKWTAGAARAVVARSRGGCPSPTRPPCSRRPAAQSAPACWLLRTARAACRRGASTRSAPRWTLRSRPHAGLVQPPSAALRCVCAPRCRRCCLRGCTLAPASAWCCRRASRAHAGRARSARALDSLALCHAQLVREDGAALAACVNAACAAAVDAGVPLAGLVGACARAVCVGQALTHLRCTPADSCRGCGGRVGRHAAAGPHGAGGAGARYSAARRTCCSSVCFCAHTLRSPRMRGRTRAAWPRLRSKRLSRRRRPRQAAPSLQPLPQTRLKTTSS
jgi:hypothetical protein